MRKQWKCLSNRDCRAFAACSGFRWTSELDELSSQPQNNGFEVTVDLSKKQDNTGWYSVVINEMQQYSEGWMRISFLYDTMQSPGSRVAWLVLVEINCNYEILALSSVPPSLRSARSAKLTCSSTPLGNTLSSKAKCGWCNP